jgi:hypothetical protein
MYSKTRTTTSGTSMTCKDCGHEIAMNKMCERPIQSATDMLKHMAAHDASRAFAMAANVMGPQPKDILAVGPLPGFAIPWIASIPRSLN